MKPEPIPQSPKRVSPWGALLGVLTNPSATFEAMAERPPILPGYLLQMAATGVVAAVTIPLTLRVAEMNAQMGAEVPEVAITVARYIAIGVGALEVVAVPWLAGVVLALAAMFFGQFVGGGVSFGRYFGMIGYAKVPVAIGLVIQGLLMTGAQSINDMQYTTLSAAALLPVDANPYLRFALMSLNPFSLWYLVLMAIGFAALHRTRPGRSLPLVITLFVVGLLMLLGQAASFSLSQQMQF